MYHTFRLNSVLSRIPWTSTQLDRILFGPGLKISREDPCKAYTLYASTRLVSCHHEPSRRLWSLFDCKFPFHSQAFGSNPDGHFRQIGYP